MMSNRGCICLDWNKWTSPGRVFILVIFIVASTNVHSQDRIGPQDLGRKLSEAGELIPSDMPIVIRTGHVHYDADKKVYTARGDVSIVIGNYEINADQAAVDLEEKTVTVEGNVVVRLGGEVIEADSVKFKLGKFTGIMTNGKIFLSKHNIYLEAKELEKTGDATYKIKQGTYTTCNGSTPAWKIYGADLEMEVDGYASLRHGFFYVKGAPVLYLPWFIYPAKRNRQTGFLTPTISSSTLKGLDIKFPFFVNISPSVDLTVTPRVCTNRALQTAMEFRYFPFSHTRGRFYGEYTYDWNFENEGGPKNHRFYLNWGHSQTLPGGIRLKAYGNWLSDRDYFEFWAGKLDKRKRIRYLESSMGISRQWNDFIFQSEARYFDDLAVSDNAVTRQHLPVVTASAFHQKIPYTPFYFGANMDYGHFYTPLAMDTWVGSRIRMNTTLSLPIALGRFLKLSPSATFLPKAYSAGYVDEDGDTVEKVETLRTDLYQVNAHAHTDLHAIYNGSFLGFQKVKHSIRPSVSWIFRPTTPTGDYPVFDDSDKVENVSLLTAELSQTFTGKIGEDEYLDFISFNLSQGYDFYTTRTAEDPLGTRLTPLLRLTNTRAKFSLKPHSLVDLSAEAEFNPSLNRASKYLFDMALMDHRGDLLRIEHQYTEGDADAFSVRQTNLDLQVKVTENLACYVQNQYSHSFDFSYFTSFGVSYHPQCWSIALKYSQAREKDPDTSRITVPEQTVFLTLAIGQLGPVYSMTRDLGELAGQWGVFSSKSER